MNLLYRTLSLNGLLLPLAQTLQSQYSYSAWYFTQSTHVSDINMTVTIALMSSILATRQATNIPRMSMYVYNCKIT